MKTLELAQFGVEELSNQEMISNHGGGDNTSLINIGDITISDLVNISGNSLFNGNYSLFSGNGTSVSPGTSVSVSVGTSES
ncbi:hypothetical protein [Spirosoma gilvum]